MKVAPKSYALHILDAEYHVVSDESESHLVQAAALVDRMMRDIAGNTTRTDKQKVAVLAALQIASSLLYSQQESMVSKEHEQVIMARLEKILNTLS